jgi:hypothetical protein
MEPSAFFYIPLTLPSPPFWGRGLRRELSRTIKVRGHALSIRHSIIYTNINKSSKLTLKTPNSVGAIHESPLQTPN